MNRLRLAVLPSLLAVLALAVAACGGGSSDKGSSGADVDELLKQTFTGAKTMKSGKLDLSLELDAKSGGSSPVNGPVTVRLRGPFQSQDNGQVPKFRLEAAFEGAGQSISAGATSTGEKGYLSFQGQDYVVSDDVFAQFKAGYEQARKQGSSAQQGQSFATLGMDPRQWLTGAKNEGDAKVGDDDTIKITGGVDVPKLLDDVDNALAKLSSLGLQNQRVPQRLSAAEKRQIEGSVHDPRVAIYTGKDDKVMRRLVVNLGITDKRTNASGTVAFDVAISDLNEDQDIPEPSNAKPFDQLTGQLGKLGLGAGGGSSSSSGGGSSSKNLEKYSKCITDAGNDAAKARKCADLLTG